MRKLKRYTPTTYKGDGSAYNKAVADAAVSFIGCLKHEDDTLTERQVGGMVTLDNLETVMDSMHGRTGNQARYKPSKRYP